VSALVHRERPAAGDAEGLLVLHHGRGSDEHDLLGLGELLDPAHRLHVITPRAPLQPPGSVGNHWYLVPRVGYPDPTSFHAARAQLGELHDELLRRTSIAPARMLLGGFSMGAVMSYALGLDPERPAPGAILAFSGFIPTVERWTPALEPARGTRVFVAHGRRDPVISVDFARDARARLQAAQVEVDYHESDVAHQIDPAHVEAAREWLHATLARGHSPSA
jgi:phospholipase/carboxylesterase